MRLPTLPLILLLTTLAACSHTDPKHTPTTTQTTGSITWHSCQEPTYQHWFKDPNYPPPEQLQCGYLNVPIDHQQPNGKTIRLAISRLAATGSNPIGNLIVLAGGPGQDSLNPNLHVNGMAEYGSNRMLRSRFHIIGIAPRGITPSEPEIDCGALPEAESRDPKVRVDGCIRLTDPQLLANISTQDAAQDIEHLRQALGGEKISLIGYSYGTKLLTTYAEQHGQHIRAGVLDGVVDTTETWFPMLANQKRGFQRSFNRFAAECSAKRNCLFSSRQRAQAEFHAFLRRVDGKNLRDRHGHSITGDKVLAAAETSLYWRQLWPLFQRMMNEIDNGQTQAYNQLTYDLGFAPPDEKGEMPSAHWALIAVNCADYALPHNQRGNYLAQSRALDAASPYRNYRRASTAEYLDECYHWPHEGKDHFARPRLPEGSPHLLFISHTEDPTTPHHNAQAMAEHLNAPLISITGNGHTAAFFGQSSCTDKNVIQYLIDPQQLTDPRQCRDLPSETP